MLDLKRKIIMADRKNVTLKKHFLVGFHFELTHLKNIYLYK